MKTGFYLVYILKIAFAISFQKNAIVRIAFAKTQPRLVDISAQEQIHISGADWRRWRLLGVKTDAYHLCAAGILGRGRIARTVQAAPRGEELCDGTTSAGTARRGGGDLS